MSEEPDPEEQCLALGFLKPSRRARRVDRTPRVGQYYWVDFPHDAYPPEFVEEHPGIVIRAARSLNDVCMIVPVTSSPQPDAKHVHRLSRNPNPAYRSKPVWAVCNHIYTISLARLRPVVIPGNKAIYPRVEQPDMEAIFACIRYAIPQIAPPIVLESVQVSNTLIVAADGG